MSRVQSRAIGGFLKSILHDEGLECSDYPTLSIVRTSPQGQIDAIWSVGQLAQCYVVTDGYLIQADDVEVNDQTGRYTLDYLSIVIRRDGDGWLVQVFTNIEDIYPNTEDPKELRERFSRTAEKARKAILAFVE